MTTPPERDPKPATDTSHRPRPMQWSSLVRDGNVTNADNPDSSWISAGGQGQSKNHDGKILPNEKVGGEKRTHKRHNLSGDDNSSKFEEDSDTLGSVFIIFCSWTIPEIEDHLSAVADSDDQIGSIRIDYFKSGQTNRTIVVMKPHLYQKLQSKSVSGFFIEPYVVRDHWFPHEKDGEVFNFFIPLPTSLNTAACREGLKIKLLELVSFGILESENDYDISIPVADREATQHTNRAYVEFGSNVDRNAIVMARCVITYSRWSYKNIHVDEDNKDLVKCYYKKDSPPSRGRFQSKDHPQRYQINKGKSSPKAPVRPRVSLKIPTIPLDSDSNTNPFALLSPDNTGDTNDSQ